MALDWLKGAASEFKDTFGDAFREAKDAYVEIEKAKAARPYRASVNEQRNLTNTIDGGNVTDKPMTATQQRQLAAELTSNKSVVGFWNGLEGWQKAVLGLGTAGLVYMAVRPRR